MDVSGNDNGRRREVETVEKSVGNIKIELEGYHRGESDVEGESKEESERNGEEQSQGKETSGTYGAEENVLEHFHGLEESHERVDSG